MHKHLQAGFSMIELVISLNIIAILITLALPIYIDFQHKSQITSGLRMAGPVQLAVSVYLSTHETFPVNNIAANLPEPDELGSRYVRSIEITDQPKAGTIRISYRAMGSVAEGDSLLLVPVNYGEDILWDCTSNTILKSLLPHTCR